MKASAYHHEQIADCFREGKKINSTTYSKNIQGLGLIFPMLYHDLPW
jgi:hypothetical protein